MVICQVCFMALADSMFHPTFEKYFLYLTAHAHQGEFSAVAVYNLSHS